VGKKGERKKERGDSHRPAFSHTFFIAKKFISPACILRGRRKEEGGKKGKGGGKRHGRRLSVTLITSREMRLSYERAPRRRRREGREKRKGGNRAPLPMGPYTLHPSSPSNEAGEGGEGKRKEGKGAFSL